MMNSAFDPLLLARIEDASLNASAPRQQRWLDGWLVRFAAGKAKRARCINAVCAGRADLATRLRSCEAVYREAGLPMIFRITPFSQPPDLDRSLDRIGLVRGDETQVMLMALGQEMPAAAAHAPAHGSSIDPIGFDDFAECVGSLRDSPSAQRRAHAERLQQSPVPIHAFELRVDGAPAVYGQFSLEQDVAGLYDIITAPAYRRRGLAGQLCRHLLQQAASRGARHAYLQVEADNVPARSLYRRIGFVDAYAYHYRQRADTVAAKAAG